jgi:hypothetical protein
VVVDLAGLGIPSQNRPIRFGHDMQSGVGHTDAIRIEEGKLLAAGVVSRDTAAAREIVTSARNGFPWQASIGAGVDEFEFIRPDQKVLVNGRDFLGPLNVVRKAALGEISFVDLGADGQTSVNVAARSTPFKQEDSQMADSITIGADLKLGSPASGESLESQRSTSVQAAGNSGMPASGQAAAQDGAATVEKLRADAAAETVSAVSLQETAGPRFSGLTRVP